jgi:isopentenyldiphosphate isomerase
MTTIPPQAQDPDEPFDVVRADGAPTGLVKPRGRIHRDGDWHRALHVWVAGFDEVGEPFLMFQRRSPRKDTWPNRYDATVGGHYRAGETFAETVREIEEEIGVSPEGLTLLPLGVRVCADESQPNVIDRELEDVFLLRDDRPLTAYRPHPIELAALVRFPLVALIPFLAGDAASVQGVSLTTGANRSEAVSARVGDFIPTVDRYFLRVAIAARNALRGDRYVAV